MFSPEQIAEIRRLAAPVPFRFDVSRFNAILEQPFAHRQVVVATSYQGATTALSHARNSLAAYSDPHGFAAGPDSLHVAAVFYGGYAYAISLDDAMYAKYGIASLVDREMHGSESNYAATAKATRRNFDAETYKGLVAEHGVSFFVCNNALSGFAYDVARALTPEGTAVTRDQVVATHDDMVQHFLPGTLLVPAGVAALNAAQEAHFTFLPE